MTSTVENDSCTLEVELKFELNRHDLRKLSRSSAFKGLQIEAPVKRTMRAIYYDTPDLKLFKRDISLRVRKESRKYVQCCKSKASAHSASVDSFARKEWQWKLNKNDLDIQLIARDDELSRLLIDIDLSTLGPVFSTTIKRQTRLLQTLGGAKIRCDIDQGSLRAGEAKSKIFELELELESGPVSELLDLACLVTSIVPARLSSKTKALRGYNLVLNGTLKNWVKAHPINFPPDTTADDVLTLSMVESLKHLIANEDCVLEQSNIEGIHQMRVALRRMRAMLASFKDDLPKALTAQINKTLKQVGMSLSLARDYDVFIFEILVQAELTVGPDISFAVLRTQALKQRDRAYEDAQSCIHSPIYATLLTDLLCWVGLKPWATGDCNPLSVQALNAAHNVLENGHNNLLKLGQGLADMSEKQRHLLRIEIKKMRYAAEAFAPLYAEPSRRAYLDNLRDLQDRLGGLNDLTVSRRLIKGIKKAAPNDKKNIARASKLINKWHNQTRQTNERGLLRTWSDFLQSPVFWM